MMTTNTWTIMASDIYVDTELAHRPHKKLDTCMNAREYIDRFEYCFDVPYAGYGLKCHGVPYPMGEDEWGEQVASRREIYWFCNNEENIKTYRAQAFVKRAVDCLDDFVPPLRLRNLEI